MPSVLRGNDDFDTLGSKGLGDGQVWTDVLASRASAVEYTNTSGRAIQVIVSVQGKVAGNTFLSLVVDGIIVNEEQSGANTDGSIKGSVQAIVPNGSIYELQLTGGAQSIEEWAELR